MMGACKWRKLQVALVVLCACAIVVSIYAARVLHRRSALDLFRQYVLDPVPASVMHIKADQPKTVGGYGYVFRFAINSADLELLRRSRPFREAEMQVNANDIHWTWKDLPSSGYIGEIGSGFTVYRSGREPYWFDLGSWDNPETHALRREDRDGNTLDTQMLIYNAELGHAYFIVFHY